MGCFKVTGFEFDVSFKIGINGRDFDEAIEDLARQLKLMLEPFPYRCLVISDSYCEINKATQEGKIGKLEK